MTDWGKKKTEDKGKEMLTGSILRIIKSGKSSDLAAKKIVPV
jgi:hypothetical protein